MHTNEISKHHLKKILTFFVESPNNLLNPGTVLT